MNTQNILNIDQQKLHDLGVPREKTSDEERIGQYDENLCDARIWRDKPHSGGLGYDNIQCSAKKVDGCGCLCNRHFKMQEAGTHWTGLITEPRPENPRCTQPNLQTKKQNFGLKMWSTDKDGNDVVKRDGRWEQRLREFMECVAGIEVIEKRGEPTTRHTEEWTGIW